MKKGKETLSLKYFMVTMGSNLAGTMALILFMLILKNFISNENLAQNYILYIFFIFASIVVAVSTSIFITSIYFRNKITDIVLDTEKDQNDGKSVFKRFLSTVLFAEIIRFVLVSIPTSPGNMLGFRFFDGVFAIVPNFIFDQFYVTTKGLHSIIRERGFSFVDNIVFIAVCFVYFVVNIIILYFAYLLIWKDCVNKRENEIKIRMDPTQMK